MVVGVALWLGRRARVGAIATRAGGCTVAIAPTVVAVIASALITLTPVALTAIAASARLRFRGASRCMLQTAQRRLGG